VVALTLAQGFSLPAGPAGSSITTACGSAPGIACRLVWDLSHSSHAANFTSVYLAGPIRLALRVALVLVIALLVRAAAARLIRRITTRTAASHDPLDMPHSRRSQRATAIASVLGNAASVTIFSIAALIILGDLGLNLAPVLASAGVLGIAFGFGAQNLVQDFLAGVFILLEDQYGVGDIVDVSSVTGTVEAVSLRITRLRDINGVVWHIRNGTIKRAGNETHGWARAVVDFPVPYGVPIAAARSALERAAAQMADEPRWQAAIIEPPEVWGIEQISPETLLVRVTARTAPLAKLDVTRELRERLKEALDAQQADVAVARQQSAAEPVEIDAVAADQSPVSVAAGAASQALAPEPPSPAQSGRRHARRAVTREDPPTN